MIYVLSLEAQRDLRHIHRYIAQRNPARADSYIDEIEAKCQLLADNHHLGVAGKFRRGLRFHPFDGTYLILFRPTPYGVDIARVVDGRRQLKTLRRP